MKIDARPFFTLRTPLGFARALRPVFNARTVGVGGSAAGGVIDVAATHTVQVFAPYPADLQPNALVSVDDTDPPGRYRVQQVAPTPAGATVYLAADPAQTTDPYTAEPGGLPRRAQRLPYED